MVPRTRLGACVVDPKMEWQAKSTRVECSCLFRPPHHLVLSAAHETHAFIHASIDSHHTPGRQATRGLTRRSEPSLPLRRHVCGNMRASPKDPRYLRPTPLPDAWRRHIRTWGGLETNVAVGLLWQAWENAKLTQSAETQHVRGRPLANSKLSNYCGQRCYRCCPCHRFKVSMATTSLAP